MQILKELTCPHCQSGKVVKNGKKHNCSQNYLCKKCQKQFQDEYLYWGADKKKQDLTLKMLLRGSGVRDCSQVLGISTGAVLSCIGRNAEQSRYIGKEPLPEGSDRCIPIHWDAK